MYEYGSLDVTVKDQVATIQMLGHEESRERLRDGRGTKGGRHREMADAMDAMRGDDDIRVIVLTGKGEHFGITQTVEEYTNPSHLPVDPAGNWRNFGSIVRVHQAMVEIEKPIVAKVT